jgi:hypothetical protein
MGLSILMRQAGKCVVTDRQTEIHATPHLASMRCRNIHSRTLTLNVRPPLRLAPVSPANHGFWIKWPMPVAPSTWRIALSNPKWTGSSGSSYFTTNASAGDGADGSPGVSDALGRQPHGFRLGPESGVECHRLHVPRSGAARSGGIWRVRPRPVPCLARFGTSMPSHVGHAVPAIRHRQTIGAFVLRSRHVKRDSVA